MGQILSLAFSAGHGLPRPLHERAQLVAGHGIDGDARAGHKPERALNILSQRQLESLQAAGYAVAPGAMGENLVIGELDLEGLPAGSRLQLGPVAVLRIVKDRVPCENLSYLHPDFPAVLAGRVGQMCAVEVGGPIRVGDAVSVLEPRIEGSQEPAWAGS